MKTSYIITRLFSMAAMLSILYSCMDKSLEKPASGASSSSSGIIQEFAIVVDGITHKGVIEKDSLIQVKVPYADVRSVKPIIKLASGASVNPSPSQVVDLSKDVLYKAIDAKGISKTYVVRTSIAPASLAITAMSIENQVDNPVIDVQQHTIMFKVTQSSDLSKLAVLSISSADKTSASLPIGQPIDFSAPVKFMIKGIYGESQEWIATVTKDIVLSDAKDILSIKVVDENAAIGGGDTHYASMRIAQGANETISTEINKTDYTVTFIYYNSTDITYLKVTEFTVSSGATVVGGTPTYLNLSTPLVFTVRAENGTTAAWKVKTINKGLNKISDIQELEHSNVKTTGYDFMKHSILSNDNSNSFYYNDEVIKNLDMRAQIQTINQSHGGAESIELFYNFRSGYKLLNNNQLLYINTTKYVKVDGINFNDVGYADIKSLFDNSSAKTNDIGAYTLQAGDMFIAKIRDSNYYTIIRITSVTITGEETIKYSFMYRY